MRAKTHQRLAGWLSFAALAAWIVACCGGWFHLGSPIAHTVACIVLAACGVPLLLLNFWFERRMVHFPLVPEGLPVPPSGVQVNEGADLPPGTRVLIPEWEQWFRGVVLRQERGGRVLVHFLGWDEYWDCSLPQGVLQMDLQPPPDGYPAVTAENLEGPIGRVAAALCKPGETAVYLGKPCQGDIPPGGGWLPFVFMVFWTLGALAGLIVGSAGLAMAIAAGELEGVWGLLAYFLVTAGFSAIGIWMLFFEPTRETQRRARTDYLVTTERVIIITGLPKRCMRWLPLDETEVAVEYPSTVTFTPLTPYGCWYRGQPGPIYHPAGIAFVLPDDAASVRDLIRSLQNRQPPPCPPTSRTGAS